MYILLRGTLDQRLRLASGLVLLAFVATHFLNHAVGLAGLDAMIEVQTWRTAITRSMPGSVILFGAFAVHIGLALWKLSRRSTLRMPAWEALQIATGLAIPYLLIQHVIFNRGANLTAGTHDTYAYELANLWPDFALDQTLLLIVVWAHAVIGLHYWLRLDRRTKRYQTVLVVAATALPILALTGFLVAGREVAERLAEPGARAALLENAGAPSFATASWLYGWKGAVQQGFYALVVIALAFPLASMATRAARERIGITYIAGPLVKACPGPSLLEISRISGVPHASVCGGRARCSTCRVHVGTGAATLPPPGRAEHETLASIKAPAGVRLACQIRPAQDIVVRRIVPINEVAGLRALTSGQYARPHHGHGDDQGREDAVAVLFFDLRGFTSLSENRLPYDIVFLLNGLFTAITGEIERAGGRVDKYMGDGLMAVFDGNGSLEEACRDALRATIATDLALETFSASYHTEIGRPLSCAMGLHAGLLVVGRIGGGTKSDVTVIGPAVNTASRLETLAKERDAQLVVSRAVLEACGFPLGCLEAETISVRGQRAPVDVFVVTRARDLDQAMAV